MASPIARGEGGIDKRQCKRSGIQAVRNDETPCIDHGDRQHQQRKAGAQPPVYARDQDNAHSRGGDSENSNNRFRARPYRPVQMAA